MSAVGSLVFCTDCGNLMATQLSAGRDIECDQCDATFSSAGEYDWGKSTSGLPRVVLPNKTTRAKNERFIASDFA